jgi:ribosomal protein S18 acetylase RimI-like enzyme
MIKTHAAAQETALETPGEYRFREARADQADALLALYRSSAQNMNDHHIYQWNTSYPDRDTILGDIARGQLLVLEGAEADLAGAVTINRDLDIPPPDLGGPAWEGEAPYGVLHRLCVHPRLQGRGLGRKLIQHSAEYGRSRGFRSLRLMVLDANTFAKGLYLKTGFVIRGEYPVKDFGAFLFMEKTIE